MVTHQEIGERLQGLSELESQIKDAIDLKAADGQFLGSWGKHYRERCY